MENYSELVKQLKEKNPGLVLPPPSMEELGIEYLEIIPAKEIRAKLPFKRKFTNPAGLYQGGFLAAALDEVFGPLAFITHKAPCLTLSINMTYLKPFTEEMKECTLHAKVLKETKQFIFMRAEILSPDNQLMAHGESHVTKVIK